MQGENLTVEQQNMEKDKFHNACLRNAKAMEPLFVLRAQDRTAPYVVAEWITANIMTAPEDKLRDALETALLMRNYKFKKTAD